MVQSSSSYFPVTVTGPLNTTDNAAVLEHAEEMVFKCSHYRLCYNHGTDSRIMLT